MKIYNKLYGGEVELVFDPLKHQYTVDGEVIKSSTGVLGILNKPALVPWAAKVTVESMREQFKPGVAYDEIQIGEMLDIAKRANYVKKTNAGQIGTLSHNFAEAYAKKLNPQYPINEIARKSCERFVKWAEDNKVDFRLTEQPVYSRKHKVAGTLDSIAIIDKKLTLIDYKTSSGVWDEYYLQVGSYGMMRNEEFPMEVFTGGAKIVRFGKDDDDFEVKDITPEQLAYYGETFVSVLDVARRMDRVTEMLGKKKYA